MEATKRVLAEGGERAERFFRIGFDVSYSAYNRGDWEVNTLFCDRDYEFRPGTGAELIDAHDVYRGIEGYIEAQLMLLDVWADVRIELLGVHVRPPDQVVTTMAWRGTAARSGLAMEWNCVSENRFRDGLAVAQTFWWDRGRAERDLGFTLGTPARR